MTIVVDANIVFSGILNSNGKIGDLLINAADVMSFIAPEFLKTEIRKHYFRLSKISNLTAEEVIDAEYRVCKNIRFISEEQIKKSNWLAAEKLVEDIDAKDVQYVAFAKQFKCKIWSGDKLLMKGLAKKRFMAFIDTETLFIFWQKRIAK